MHFTLGLSTQIYYTSRSTCCFYPPELTFNQSSIFTESLKNNCPGLSETGRYLFCNEKVPRRKFSFSQHNQSFCPLIAFKDKTVEPTSAHLSFAFSNVAETPVRRTQIDSNPVKPVRKMITRFNQRSHDFDLYLINHSHQNHDFSDLDWINWKLFSSA